MSFGRFASPAHLLGLIVVGLFFGNFGLMIRFGCAAVWALLVRPSYDNRSRW